MGSLNLCNISKIYNRCTVLSSININLNDNHWSYIVGGNGSGKTTLLKIIMGEIKPDSGKLFFDEEDITKTDSYRRANKFQYIEQETKNNLINSMTVYENLIFGINNGNSIFPNFKLYKKEVIKENIIKILSAFSLDLELRLNEQVRFLSGGERQSIVAAKIMLNKPKVLLLDEFTSSLDQKTAPMTLRLLKSYTSENNIAVIIVTHDYSYIEETGDRVILLDNGIIKGDYSKDKYRLTEQFILSKFHERKN
jgi:putative tryptophan/tyrosine transport system ATP-binding protein